MQDLHSVGESGESIELARRLAEFRCQIHSSNSAPAFCSDPSSRPAEHTMPVSQIGVQVPVVFSFAIAPAVFLFLHAYTLIRYDMLAANLRQFRTDLLVLVPREADRDRCRQLLAMWNSCRCARHLEAHPCTVGSTGSWAGS